MKLLARIGMLGAVLLGMSTFSTAAEIKRLTLPGGLVVVDVRGEIVTGDARRFLDLVRDDQRVSVILRSDGGLIAEALKIGAEIRMRNFATMVPADSDCHSACGLIWVSGARRYMSKTSRIGFHAAYRTRNGQVQESGMGNAEIGSFLTHLGLRIEAIRYFTVAAPDEIALLSPERARALGIDVFENNDGAMTTPNQAPTADSHADAFVSYSFLQARCTDALSVDKGALAVGVRRAFDEGNRLVGPDKWIDLWTPMLDEVKRQVSEKGVLGLCLETVETLRSGGRPTGISGPSFDCAKATSLIERAICSDQGLWAKDRAMNQLYLAGRAMPAAARKRFLDEQRAWMTARDRCADERCVHQAYDQRLGAFRKVDLSQPER